MFIYALDADDDGDGGCYGVVMVNCVSDDDDKT